MRLYYFTTAKYGLENIEKRRLKIAKINELNDPFEILGIAMPDSVERAIWHNWKCDMSALHGLLCMTTKYTHPLMWSHYAKSHTGICLGFDINPDLVEKINYRSNRFTKEELGINSLEELDEAQMRKLLYSKHSAWRYEREWRLSVSFEPPAVDNKLEFANFSDDLILRQVIAGSESDISRSKIEAAIGDLETIEKKGIFKMRPAFKSFNVVRNRDERFWK